MTEKGSSSREPLAARLLAAFIDEIGEHQRSLVAEALALERDPGNAERQASVFRTMHTIKGAARAASVPSIESLCHAVEGELAQARKAGAALTPAQISLLLATADAFADAAAELRAGRAAPEGSVAALLHRVSGKKSAAVRDAPRKHQPVIAEMPKIVETVVEPEAAAVAVTRDEHVRIGSEQLESLFSAVGELLGLASRMEDYPQLLTGDRGTPAEGLSRAALSTIGRRMGGDVNALRTLSSRLLQSVRLLQQSPFSEAVEILPRTVRDAAVSVGKSARLVIDGAEVEAERGVLEMLRVPLMHLARNAVDHGLESAEERTAAGKNPEGTVRVSAVIRGDRLRITVSDDGRGVDVDAIRRRLIEQRRLAPESDTEIARLMFEEGFSSRNDVNAISGRGVGLAIVHDAVEQVGGSVDVTWTKGKGTSITMEVPVSVAITRALLVDVGGYQAALPSAFVDRIERVARDRVRSMNGVSVLDGGGAPVPVVSLAARLGEPFASDGTDAPTLVVVWLSALSRRLAVVVRDVIDERELVLRPVPFNGGGDLVAGAALLPDGNVAIVLDVPGLIADRRAGASGVSFEPAEIERPRRILVVDDSITTRTLEASVLTASGYDVTTAVDGMDGWRLLQEGGFDLVVSDVQMPGMDGLEFCKRIRSTPAVASTPVILVTSLDKQEEKMEGLEAGADAYITKSSFDQETLLGTIRQLIGRSVNVKS
ncbi:MAG TPA: response regulator [Gemmatimonadaceae bacterium]|nr:response regulator [Gemmatimonadaceae bacterium]